MVGKQGGETKIILDDGPGLQQSFLNLKFVQKALGTPALTVIKETSDNIKAKQKVYEEERKKRADAENNLGEQDDEIMKLNDWLNKENEKINQLKELPGYEEQIERKKQLAKNLKKDLQDAINKRKEQENKVKNLSDQDKKNSLQVFRKR